MSDFLLVMITMVIQLEEGANYGEKILHTVSHQSDRSFQSVSAGDVPLTSPASFIKMNIHPFFPLVLRWQRNRIRKNAGRHQPGW